MAKILKSQAAQPMLLDVARYDPERQYWLQRTELALMLGVTEKTINNWQRDHGFPTRDPKTGLLDLRRIMRFCGEELKHRWSLSARLPGGVREEIQAERLRMLRLERQKAEGEVIDAEERMALELRCLHELRTNLQAAGRQLAADMPDAAAFERRYAAAMDAALNTIADQWDAHAEPPQPDQGE